MSELVRAAEFLGESRNWQPSGYVQFRKQLAKGGLAGDYVIITLNFYGTKELAELHHWAKTNGLEGFTDEAPKPPQEITVSQMFPQDTPQCPAHKKPMVLNDDGSGWCKGRTGGGFCKWRMRKTGEIYLYNK
jgi:hypothetical protein